MVIVYLMNSFIIISFISKKLTKCNFAIELK